MRAVLVFGLVLVLALAQVSSGVYLELVEGANKCFLEEVPKDTLVLTNFDAQQLVEAGQIPDPRFQSLAIRATVRDPSNNVLLQKVLPTVARFAFTARIGGEHQICFQTNSSRWFGGGMKLKFSLDIDTGAAAIDYEELAKVEHLDNLAVQVRRLNDRVRAIRKEQAYQRSREEEHRDTSESTNSRVVGWTVFSTVLLSASGLWQIYRLKPFLKRRMR